ncbi:MAG TPA: hypothetical protein VFU22_09080 [Roseiflexaceae bacterium]|nr:hypothetical protein [Roseiflexaceae bacterium]
MEQRKTITDWLIAWVCFVGCVTWLDYTMFLSLFSSGRRMALVKRSAVKVVQ